MPTKWRFNSGVFVSVAVPCDRWSSGEAVGFRRLVSFALLLLLLQTTTISNNKFFDFSTFCVQLIILPVRLQPLRLLERMSNEASVCKGCSRREGGSYTDGKCEMAASISYCLSFDVAHQADSQNSDRVRSGISYKGTLF